MDMFAQWLTPFLSGGSLLALPLVIVGGLITAFNPCCLPMYPAVFGFLGGACGKNSETSLNECNKENSKPLTNITLLFILGMATATSVMGILTAALGWVFGRFDSNFLILLATIPLLIGLNLLGLFPFKIPAWHIVRLQAATGKNFKNKVTAFSAGVIFSLAIAPCATPILLGILTLVAMQGDLFYGGILMFIYGFGAGLPLLFIGHGFNKLQSKITLSCYSKWLQKISGLLLISVSIYVMWNI